MKIKRLFVVSIVMFALLLAGGCSKKTKVKFVNADSSEEIISVGDDFVNIESIKVGSTDLGTVSHGEESKYEEATEGFNKLTLSGVMIFIDGTQVVTLTTAMTDQVFLVKEKKNAVILNFWGFAIDGCCTNWGINPEARVELGF